MHKSANLLLVDGLLPIGGALFKGVEGANGGTVGMLLRTVRIGTEYRTSPPVTSLSVEIRSTP